MPFPDLQLAGKLDDQNGVFTGQAHQDHQTHLHEDVVIAPGQPDAKQRGEHRHRYDKDHRQRQGPAFIQRGQYEECQQHRHREDDQRRVALGGLLEAEIRPLNIHPIRQDLLRQLFQMRHRLRRREDPRIGIANQVRRRITVVADHRIRPVGGTDIHHTADRYHFALIIAGAQIGDIFHALAVWSVSLGHHAPGTPELVKVIDIRRAEIGLQRTEQIG